ncbi:hypothetical protein D3C80_2067000 [compost metagenome]
MWDQQARFQIGKPCRHDEIVGGKLDADAARPLDEGDILLGECKYGDARKIDTLAAGKMKEKIERAFETGKINHQRFFMQPAL